MSFQPCRRQALGIGAGIAAASVLASCSRASLAIGEGTVLADTADVPEGEAIPLQVGETPLILAHTPGGGFRAFIALCPHQGCKVITSAEQQEVLLCPCHRSEFDTYSGEVLKGPAQEDLPELDVTVKDGKVIAG